MPSSEAGLTASIMRALVKAHPDAWVFHPVGSPLQQSGIPDLLACIDGLLVGAEIKFVRPNETHKHAVERTTPRQRYQLGRINAAGGIAGTVTSTEEMFDLIRRGFVKREVRRGAAEA